MGHLTAAEPEVWAVKESPSELAVGVGSRDSRRTRSGHTVHMTAAKPGVRAGHLTPAEPKVACPSPSWIPAGVIFALGLMSLMGTTCVGLGRSRVWREVSLAPWGDHVTTAKTEVRSGHVTPAEPELGRVT